MDIIKKICIAVVALVIGLTSGSIAQGLPILARGTSFLTNQELVVSSTNIYHYKRNAAASINGFPLNAPSFGIGQATPTAVLDVNGVSYIRGNIIKNAKNVNKSMSNLASSGVTINISTTNVVYLTLNVSAININGVINIENDIATATKPRAITIYVNYVGTNPLASLKLMAQRTGPTTATYDIKWPNGDSPVFTKTLNKIDIIHLFYTGTGWGTDPTEGEYYGIVSFNH